MLRYSPYAVFVFEHYKRMVDQGKPEVQETKEFEEISSVMVLQALNPSFDLSFEEWVQSRAFGFSVFAVKNFFVESYRLGIKEFEEVQQVVTQLENLYRTAGEQTAKEWYSRQRPFTLVQTSGSLLLPDLQTREEILNTFDRALMLRQPQHLKRYKLQTMFNR